MSYPVIEPFKISFPDKDVQDLLDSLNNFNPDRILKTLLPGSQSLDTYDFKYGISPQAYLELLSACKTYNWKEWEERLNDMGEHGIMKTEDGTKLHFIHKRCTENKDAKALLLIHGWP
jgi:hypothetical protein